MNFLLLNQTATPTQPPAEIIRDAVRVLDTWEQLGPLMALLGIVALALIVVAMIQFSSRNTTTSAINVLAQANTSKENEIQGLRSQLIEYQRLHGEGLSLIATQSARTNDLFDAMNNRSANRDLQQQEMVATQGRIAAAFDRLLNEGSQPLQQVARDMIQLLSIVTAVDTRTNGWQAAMETLPQIKQDINLRLDGIMTELQKRSTKPIPKVEVAPSPEANPQ